MVASSSTYHSIYRCLLPSIKELFLISYRNWYPAPKSSQEQFTMLSFRLLIHKTATSTTKPSKITHACTEIHHQTSCVNTTACRTPGMMSDLIPVTNNLFLLKNSFNLNHFSSLAYNGVHIQLYQHNWVNNKMQHVARVF